MTSLQNSSLGETDAQILVCPVYEDFLLELPPTRRLKVILEKSTDFFSHRREVKRHLKEGGSFFQYSFPEDNFIFHSIYYLNVRTFFTRPSFSDISRSIAHIFADISKNAGSDRVSVATSLLGLDYFSPDTEFKILADGIRRAYIEDQRVYNLEISICIGEYPTRSIDKRVLSQIFSRPSAPRT